MGPTEWKVLVTGANGFTGACFCHYLAKRGVPTRGLYYAPDGAPEFSYPNLKLVPGDLRAGESLKRALDGIEIVQSVAALYRPTNVPQKAYWDVNVDGIRNIVEEAARAEGRSAWRGVHHRRRPRPQLGCDCARDDLMTDALGVRPPRPPLPYPLLYGAAAACEVVLKPFPVWAPLHRRRAAWFNSTRQSTSPRLAPRLRRQCLHALGREPGGLVARRLFGERPALPVVEPLHGFRLIQAVPSL